MTGWGDVIPPELLSPYKKQEFLEWLASLGIDIWTKKYILIYWCAVTGTELTEELVNYVTGGKARWTRDK